MVSKKYRVAKFLDLIHRRNTVIGAFQAVGEFTMASDNKAARGLCHGSKTDQVTA